MTAGAANQRASELVKAYIENQQMHSAFGDHPGTGTAMAEMITAMHAKLFEYFQKVKD